VVAAGPVRVVREMARDLLRQGRLDSSQAVALDSALRDHNWIEVLSTVQTVLAGAGPAARDQSTAPALPVPDGPTLPADGRALLRLALQLGDSLARALPEDLELARAWVRLRAELAGGPGNSRALARSEADFGLALERALARSAELGAARASLRDLLGGMVERLGGFGARTEQYAEHLLHCQQALAGPLDAGALARLAGGLLEDSRGVIEQIRDTRTELDAARRKVEAYESRVRELEQALDKAAQLVRKDPLTQALNRRGLEEAFALESARAQRLGTALSVAMIDLDDFKVLNDSLGHVAGDRALVHLVTTLQAGLRATEVIARSGGEEFVILFAASEAAVAVAAMGRLRAAIARCPFTHAGSRHVLTFSGGVVQWLNGEPLADTLRRADQALYGAKRAGKDCIIGA
jgi:diguanylate cyclase